MDNTEYIPVLSLCPGSLGLERCVKRVWPGVRTVAYVEIEAFINFNLVAAMEAGLVDQAPIWTDIKTFDGRPFRDKVHGIIAGYPCQGESSAGLRKLEKDLRYLWPYIRRIISETKPVWCFFENVRSHLSGTFKYVLRDLHHLGYEVEQGIYSAAEVGASHIRERLFILACSDIGEMRRCVANADNNGSGESLQGYQPAKLVENGNQWPASPGEQQYEWEEPRTVEPGMGSTVNGYNFRTELLRMYGNGVVQQTAEKAFKGLLEKHFKNHG